MPTQKEIMDIDDDIPEEISTKREAERYFEEAKSRFDGYESYAGDSADLDDVEMDWRDMGSTAGETSISKEGKVEGITLNPKLLEKMPERTPITIIHELAHAVQSKVFSRRTSKGHDFYWKEIMRYAGVGNPKRVIKHENILADNYVLECSECGFRIGRKRKSKVVKNPQNYGCPECRGKLERVK